jgi:hypothetical protein
MYKKVLPISLSLLLSAMAWTSPLLAADAKDDTPTTMQFGKGDMAEVEVENLHHSGKLLVKKIKVAESTIINGSLQAVNSEFKQQTVINGQLQAVDSKFNDLSVNGGANLKNIEVKGPADINGSMKLEKSKFDNTLNVNGQLTAKDSSFSKMLTLKSKEIDLENCSVQDITVQKGPETQTLNLKGTKVAGSVTFESGKGIIKQDDKSTIEGKVTGATVQK